MTDRVAPEGTPAGAAGGNGGGGVSPEGGAPQDGERDPLDALAEEFTARQRRGESPSISEYVARYPDLADRIRKLFPTIAAIERLKVH